MYFYMFIVCVNTRTSRIKTNLFFDLIDFQATSVCIDSGTFAQMAGGGVRVRHGNNRGMFRPRSTTTTTTIVKPQPEQFHAEQSQDHCPPEIAGGERRGGGRRGIRRTSNRGHPGPCGTNPAGIASFFRFFVLLFFFYPIYRLVD